MPEEGFSSETDSDKISDDDSVPPPNLASLLSDWAIQFGVSLVALSALLTLYSEFTTLSFQRMVGLC